MSCDQGNLEFSLVVDGDVKRSRGIIDVMKLWVFVRHFRVGTRGCE